MWLWGLEPLLPQDLPDVLVLFPSLTPAIDASLALSVGVPSAWNAFSHFVPCHSSNLLSILYLDKNHLLCEASPSP